MNKLFYDEVKSNKKFKYETDKPLFVYRPVEKIDGYGYVPIEITDICCRGIKVYVHKDFVFKFNDCQLYTIDGYLTNSILDNVYYYIPNNI